MGGVRLPVFGFLNWWLTPVASENSAQDLHNSIRKTYGSHTALLPLFTAAPSAAVPQPRARGATALWDPTGLTVPSTLSHSATASSSLGLGVSDAGLETVTTANEVVESPPAVKIEKGQELSEEDFKSIRVFLREMVVQSIVPSMERAIQIGNANVRGSFLPGSVEAVTDPFCDLKVCRIEAIYWRTTLQRR